MRVCSPTSRIEYASTHPRASPIAGYASNGGERPPTEATVKNFSVLGHGRNRRDVTVVWWPGLPDVM
jgi:hypothetical protein